MKSHFFYNSRVQVWLWLFCCFIACDSTNSSSPDLAATVEGNYQLVYLNLAGTEITPDFIMLVGGSTVITAKKKTTDQIELALKVVVRGTTTETTKKFSLSDAGNKAINILEAGVRVGTYSNGQLDINTTFEGGTLKLIAKK
jgi:hypothetical protein